MNPFQKLRRLLFGTEYVLLVNHYDRLDIRPVHFLAGYPFSMAPSDYFDQRVKLFPKGKLVGNRQTVRWEPITPKMQEYFDHL